MPQKYGAQLSKRQKTAANNRIVNIQTAVEDSDAYFGRVLKINMGRCVVNIWDHTRRRHIEVQARLPNKKKGFIQINDIVNVAPSLPDWEVQLALDSKTTAELLKKGRITAGLLDYDTGADGGDVFENTAEEEDENVDEISHMFASMKLSSSKMAAFREGGDDDEIDIDAI